MNISYLSLNVLIPPASKPSQLVWMHHPASAPATTIITILAMVRARSILAVRCDATTLRHSIVT
ncbi:hypothetical protein BTHE_0034 [Bifidobacterium thermophilum]|nr:hypothetical protein BTHE_0034 [Bifidobacterium thermophilum]